MNISSISAGSKSYLPIRANSEIKMLEKQKEQLEKQIQTTKESDMDAKSKQETIKLLQEQIQQIETQIQQKRNEKLTESIKNNSNGSDSKSPSRSSNTETGEASFSGMSDLLEANASLSRARIVSSTRDSLNGKSNILAQEIKLDESRGGNPKEKKAELADSKSRIQDLEKDLGSELQYSQEEVKAATEATDGDKAETANSMKEANKEEEGVPSSLTWFLENGDKYSKVDVLF